MTIKRAIKFIAVCALSITANATFAHVVLQEGLAKANTSYRATFRVGHGCDGSSTNDLRVIIPAGFNGAQPMPKPGWTVYTKVGPLEVPYESHGKTYTEGNLEIRWVANGAANALPAPFYDEFVLRGTTPGKAGPIWFKVIQGCEVGTNDWVEVPASGTSTKGLKAPAALLQIQAAPAAGKHAH